jgi:hypothetical protein
MRVWWTLTMYLILASIPTNQRHRLQNSGVEMEGRGDAKVSMHDHLGDQRDGPLLCHIRSHIWGPVIFPLAVSLSTPSVN